MPDNWLALLLFLLLVAPGLLFDLLSDSRRAGHEESAFREAGRVALSSLIFSGGACLLLAVLGTVFPRSMPSPRLLLTDFEKYAAAHYHHVGFALISEVLMALSLAYLAHLYLARRSGAADIRPFSAWATVFRVERPTGCDSYARLRLENGTIFVGRVAQYSAKPELDGREIVLGPPLSSAKDGGQPKPMPAEVKRVVLRGDAIRSIGVFYRPIPLDEARAVRRAWRSRYFR